MNKLSVLIVEDEGVVAVDTKLALIGYGYDVLPIAISGRKALEVAHQHKPDIILMDIKLRGPMDGIEVASRIREQGSTAIVFITGNTDRPTIERAMSTGPDRILTKPVSHDDLRVTLDEVSSRIHGGPVQG